MSRVKERENVLCAGGAGLVFCSPSIHREAPQVHDRDSLYDAGWNISPRVVFETTNSRQIIMNLERCNGRAAGALLEFPTIPVIKTTEEFETWR
jgi:hypothetical protein